MPTFNPPYANCPCCPGDVCPEYAVQLDMGSGYCAAARYPVCCLEYTDPCQYESGHYALQWKYSLGVSTATVNQFQPVVRRFNVDRIGTGTWRARLYYGVTTGFDQILVGEYQGSWSGTGTGTLTKTFDLMQDTSWDVSTPMTGEFKTCLQNLHWFSSDLACAAQDESLRTQFAAFTGMFSGTQCHSVWFYRLGAWQKWVDAPPGYTSAESEFAPTGSGSTWDCYYIPWTPYYDRTKIALPSTIVISPASLTEAECGLQLTTSSCETFTASWDYSDQDVSFWSPGVLLSHYWYSGLNYAWDHSLTTDYNPIGAGWVKHGGSWFHNQVFVFDTSSNTEEPVASSSRWSEYRGMYDSGESYITNDVVGYSETFGGQTRTRLYRATSATSGVAPPSAPWSTSLGNITTSHIPIYSHTAPSDCDPPCTTRPAEPWRTESLCSEDTIESTVSPLFAQALDVPEEEESCGGCSQKQMLRVQSSTKLKRKPLPPRRVIRYPS